MASTTSSKSTLSELAALYVERTAHFTHRWVSHRDRELHDLHVTLIAAGQTIDLVPHIQDHGVALSARAYEVVLAHQRGDASPTARADLDARVAQLKVPAWQRTYIHGPMAAASWHTGAHDAFERHLALAKKGLRGEDNPFQKKSVYGRALILTGRAEEIPALVKRVHPEDARIWHLKLLFDLADAQADDIFERVYQQWVDAIDGTGQRQLEIHLRARGSNALADRVGIELTDGPPVFEYAYRSDIRFHPEPLDTLDPATLDREDQVEWHARMGHWPEARALLKGVRKNDRIGLLLRIVDGACVHGAIDELLDVLSKLPCADMNDTGVYAMQRALRWLAAPHYRMWGE
ncbi:MAG: hypothetical protein ACE366_23780 [Bradymonadia bacterium]